MINVDNTGRRRVVPAFTEHPIPDEELMAQQGITGPQGLDALGYPDCDDDGDAATSRRSPNRRLIARDLTVAGAPTLRPWSIPAVVPTLGWRRAPR